MRPGSYFSGGFYDQSDFTRGASFVNDLRDRFRFESCCAFLIGAFNVLFRRTLCRIARRRYGAEIYRRNVPPPVIAAAVISFEGLEKSFPRLAS